jgi:hypothetical protein
MQQRQDLNAEVRDFAAGSLDALRTAVETEKSLLDTRHQAELTALETAHAARMNALDAEKERVTDSLENARSLASKLKSAFEGIKVESEAAEKFERKRAQEILQRAAQTGVLPDEMTLDKALSAVSGDSAKFFGSYQDYIRDTVRTAQDVGTLSNQAESRVSVEERTLAALEAQAQAEKDNYERSVQDAQARHKLELERLDNLVKDSERQLNSLLGIEDGNLSIAEAQEGIRTASDLIAELQAAGLSMQEDELRTSREILEAIRGLAAIQTSLQQAPAAIYERDDGTYGLVEAMPYTGETAPAFAEGGYHAGGLRLVGESGPELEITPPSRIISNGDLAGIVDIERLVAELRALRNDMKSSQFAIASNTGKTSAILNRWNGDGIPETRATA